MAREASETAETIANMAADAAKTATMALDSNNDDENNNENMEFESDMLFTATVGSRRDPINTTDYNSSVLLFDQDLVVQELVDATITNTNDDHDINAENDLFI